MSRAPFLGFPRLLLMICVLPAASNPLDSKTFLRSTNPGDGLSTRPTSRLSKPLIGDDGKVQVCLGKNFFAFDSNGTIAWIIPLDYICDVNTAPVADGRGKIYLIAEDRILKLTPNIVTSDSKVEIFFHLNSTNGRSEKIVGLSISVLYSSLFVTIQNRGLFAFSLGGQLMWSSGPMLYMFGYRQGCKKNTADCYFNTAPVVDQCEGILYISNNEGQLYSLYIRSPHFRWIHDFSSIDKILAVTPGNNGRLYVTFPRKAFLMALEVSTGNVLWQNNFGPLSTEDHLPVVDSNGWASISSVDGHLYSFSPTGNLKKYLERTAIDSVVQVRPVLDCSGFAVYTSQTVMEAKSSHSTGNYTYISATNPVKLVVTLLTPATGTVYWTGTYPGDLSSFLSKTNFHYFAFDERILLTFLSSERIGSTLACYNTRQKLSWTCLQGEHKFVSIYTDGERDILPLVVLQLVIILLLVALVRFCCVFWKKKKLQDHGLGKFLAKRRSLHKRRQIFNKIISELEQHAAEDTTNEAMAKLRKVVKAKEGVERKLTTSYSLGRDSLGSQHHSAALPLYDGSTRSYSFHSAKKECVTIFNTLSDDDSSQEGSNSKNSSDTCSSSGFNQEKDSPGCGDFEFTEKGKEPIEAGPSSSGIANPMFGGSRVDEELVLESVHEGVSWRKKLLKRKAISSTN